MNLFCFSLEGSTDSLYEPPQIHYDPEPSKPERMEADGGESGDLHPCYTPELPQTPTERRKKTAKRRSTPPASACSSDKTLSSLVWPCSRRNDDVAHYQNGDADEDDEPYATKPGAQEEQMGANVEKSDGDDHARGVNFEAWNPNLTESCKTKQHDPGADEKTHGTLRKIHSQVRTSHRSRVKENRNSSDPNGHLEQVFREDHSVTTCIGWALKPERKLGKDLCNQQSDSLQEKNITDTEAPWSPEPFQCHMDVSPLWDFSYHTCQRATAETWPHNVNFTLPRGTGRLRYEELIHDLDLLRTEYPPPRVIRSVTDLDVRASSFGRFDRHQAKPEEHEDHQVAVGEPADGDHKGGIGKKMKAISLTMRKRMGRKYAKALSEEMVEDTQRDHEAETESHAAKACTQSINSMESLCSLQSGQSSSSGITSGSEGSNNRDSLRLEEEVPHTRQFCGKAKVHTDFIPSPYDTESLKLKVGNVIDIISKTPMGIWTGMLQGKVGSFKFIYVDVLPEETTPVYRTRNHNKSRRPRPKTLQEFLERLNLEDFASSLLLNGYQTVDDLKDLKEQHLIELNLTDPEHRSKLLAATECLQDAEFTNQREGEGEAENEPKSPSELEKADLNDCPRDSGCYVASDCPENSKEDAECHLPESLILPPAEV